MMEDRVQECWLRDGHNCGEGAHGQRGERGGFGEVRKQPEPFGQKKRAADCVTGSVTVS